MIKIYGIKNCNTMQQAFSWLAENKIKYEFHNYKESGIDKDTLEHWLEQIPIDKLINTKGTTYRGLLDVERASISDKSKAKALMMSKPSMIKRPVWEFGKGKLLLGFNEEELSRYI
jgi:arsenate reductase